MKYVQTNVLVLALLFLALIIAIPAVYYFIMGVMVAYFLYEEFKD